MYLFPVAGFDNGMRQVTTIAKPVRKPDDLAGMKIRVPAGQMIFDTFQAFGAEPVTTTANLIYDALKSGRVGAQENPLAILEGFKLYELIKYVSMTNHMWSGFNLMAHLATWRGLPDDIKAVIERNATKYVRQQRDGAGHAQREPARRPRQARAPLQRGRPGGLPRQARRASTRSGRTSSAASAGRCWRPRWEGLGDRVQRQTSEVFRRKFRMFCNASQHARADFISIMERKYVVGRTRPLQRAM